MKLLFTNLAHSCSLQSPHLAWAVVINLLVHMTVFSWWLFSDWTCFFCTTQSFSMPLPVYQKTTLGSRASVPWPRGCRASNAFGGSSECWGWGAGRGAVLPSALTPALHVLCLLSPCCFSLKFCGVTDDASKSLSLGFQQCLSVEEIM